MYTSRQRVLTALDHRQPDRVPIDLGGNQTGIHKVAYQRLLDLLGLKEELAIMDLVQQLAKPSEAVLQRLHVDTRYISAQGAESFKGGVVQRQRAGRVWNDFTDEFGVTWSMPEDHPYYYDISHSPLAGLSLEQIRDYPFPKGDDPSRFAGLRDRALQLQRETPYAVVSGISGVVYEICWYLRGLENLFADMIEQPEVLETLIDRTTQFWLDWFRLFLDEVADVVDVIMIGDDLTGQSGPLFSPALYRSIIKPRQKKLVQYIKSRTRAKIWYHSCGSIIGYIPDLLDNGIDILNPVQLSAAGMDPAALKARFGGQLSFWGGGIDSQHILPRATPEQIRQHVRQNLALFKPAGGYVFNNVHNIQADVPPENILAMYDAAYEYGAYSA
ncbi:MAG TPA: uroporphyrinogen decarboxylase family protein [Tepidisphaeraceae bacterium]|nr:uroporphyrinogen decarboxylase family protein [Tepidisphaeraceae bacterium]